MLPRERVLAALHHERTDRTPRFEVWIDAFVGTFGFDDTAAAHAGLGQDSVLLPSRSLPGSLAWSTGVDEFGRRWRDGYYADGVVDTYEDLARFSPQPARAAECFERAATEDVRRRFPDHLHFFGTHVGPFQAAYLAMGMERFMLRLADDIDFVGALLDARTDWAIALFQQAVAHGAELIVMGDDAGHRGAPLISPSMWRRLVLPCHRRIVDALPVPVLWHSDGNIVPLLPHAVDAGFAGIHGLEPAAGIDLAGVRAAYGSRLVLVGNADVKLLCGSDASAVRADVARCLAQGGTDGGYMLSTCNSIYPGMNPAMVQAFFAAQAELTSSTL